jgi:hypothetical protein
MMRVLNPEFQLERKLLGGLIAFSLRIGILIMLTGLALLGCLHLLQGSLVLRFFASSGDVSARVLEEIIS